MSIRAVMGGASLILLSSCYIYRPTDKISNSIALPTKYSLKEYQIDDKHKNSKPWWFAYKDPKLNEIINRSINSNFSLSSAWSRLKSAEHQANLTNAERYPSVDFGAGWSRDRSKAIEAGWNTQNSFKLTGSLSFELDIFRRVDALAASSNAEIIASRADVENTALVLTSAVAELWFRAQEQKALIKLLSEQIEVSKTLLDLTKIRYQVGQGSALAIYQQQQQLQSVLSEVPLAKYSLKTTLNQLAILSAQPPGSMKARDIAGELPEAPKTPLLVSPRKLFDSRPDLRALRARLMSAEFRIASAAADRLPHLSLSAFQQFGAEEIANLFKGQFMSIASSLTEPIFEGGRRKAVEELSIEAAKIAANEYSNGIYTALGDVENAIMAEQAQRALLSRLKKQLNYARATLRESRERYLHGLSDYLQVTFAVQSLQGLERRILSEKRELLLSRNRIFISLGGEWTNKLTPTAEGAPS